MPPYVYIYTYVENTWWTTLCFCPWLQVTEATANILFSHGFVLEKRGKVPVKGKGELTTFFVVSEPRK